MHFCRGGKTFRFLETKSVMKVNSGLSGLHRPSSQHTYGQRQTESETLNSLHTWGNNLEQGTKFQHSAHSLSQRGMGWCHVPSAWQTAVKDSSVRLPCIHTQKKKKQEKKNTAGCMEPHIPFTQYSNSLPSHKNIIPTACLSTALSQHCAPIAGLSPCCLLSILCLLQTTNYA